MVWIILGLPCNVGFSKTMIIQVLFCVLFLLSFLRWYPSSLGIALSQTQQSCHLQVHTVGQLPEKAKIIHRPAFSAFTVLCSAVCYCCQLGSSPLATQLLQASSWLLKQYKTLQHALTCVLLNYTSVKHVGCHPAHAY